MSILDRVKTRLEAVEDKPSDKWLEEVTHTLTDRICLRVGVSTLPITAESLVVDATIKAVNRRFDEGITQEAEGQGGTLSLQFVDDLLAEYAAELSALAEIARADTTAALQFPKVRFV